MAKNLLLITLASAAWLLPGCAVNPLTGKKELMLLSEQQDIAIGEKYAPEVEKQLGGRIPNENLQNYIDNLGRKLAGVSYRRNFRYHYCAVQDKSVNALALPGGYIFITKGMLRNLSSEAQLAAVLAHETAHVVARDTANVMSNEIGINLLLSAVNSDRTAGGVLTAADLTRRILSLKYSRDDERQADLAGMDYMVAAGYNPYAMVEIMQMLQQLNSTAGVEFLSTHPSHTNRIAYLQEKIQRSYSNLAELKTGTQDYRRTVLLQLGNQKPKD